MVDLITTKGDLEKKEFVGMVMYQIRMLAKKASPDYDTMKLRLSMSITKDKRDGDTYF